MNEKVFCYECRKYVDYYEKEEITESLLKEEKYEYTRTTAYCSQCNSEVYVEHLEEQNLNKLYDVYREQNKIISLDKIKAIPQKYSIGKRPLSLLLGWGEQTFSRYYDGDMPSKQYSEILERIYEDPAYYNELLQKNKSNLKSETAYVKSRKAVGVLLGGSETTRISLAVSYILGKCEDVTPLALQKLLYYVQGFYYAFYHAFIFDDDCEAWAHGPVFRAIYQKYSNYRYDPINRSNESIDEGVFTSSERALMDNIIRYFGCYSGKVLEAFTHTERPWTETRIGLLDDESSTQVIPKQLIGEFFENVKTNYEMLTPSDIALYTREKFENYKANI